MTKVPKVLVVGDHVWDWYWDATTDRISPEAPIPVYKVGSVQVFPGGAGNVAANLRALGLDVVQVPDPTKAEERGVKFPIKHRLMVGDTQVARWDMNDVCPTIDIKHLNFYGVDAVVVADYQKGSITKNVIEIIRDACNYGHRLLFVDTKGDPSPWLECATVVFPNRKEYLQYKESYDKFPVVVEKCGAEGIWLTTRGTLRTVSPSRASFVRGVMGAGDTVIAAHTYWVLNQKDLLQNTFSSLEFCNAAAANVVEKPYTATTTVEEVLQRLNSTIDASHEEVHVA